MSLLAIGLAAAAAAPMTIRPYGTLSDGRPVREYVLRNGKGASVRFIDYGATVTSIEVPDRRGKFANVVLGFGNIRDYEARNADYRFGATVGRYAGRIAGARFSVDGKEVRLKPNDGPNALHGGAEPGLDFKLWTVTPLSGRQAGATLEYLSPAGEQGFPGAVRVRVTYRLLGDNSLRIDYEAATDAPTHLNLTNHSYFNLSGAGSGTVLDHRIRVHSSRLIETGAGGIPTGKLIGVAGTPLDFRKWTSLRTCVGSDHPLLAGGRGCNHGFALPGKRLRLAAQLHDPASGRSMDVLTTEPSIHVYTAGYMSGNDKGAQGVPYRAFDAVALEAQGYPDAPNRPNFPSTLLRPGETFRTTTVYRFSVSK